MNPVLFGIDPKWNSLLPLVAINVLMLSTVVIFAVFVYRKRPGDPDLIGRHSSKLVGPFLREYWAWFISPIEWFFIKLNVSPNTLTTLGFLLSGVSAYAFATGHMGVAGWFMIIGGTFDMFDGRVARKSGKTSKSGAFYDAVMDRFGESLVFFGLAYYYRDSWILFLVLGAMVGSLMVSYTKARGDSEGVDCKGGIMQRPERIVYLGVGSIFSPPFRQIVSPGVQPPVEYLTIAALGVIAVMTTLTAFYRMYYIFRKLRIRDGYSPKEPNLPLFRKFTHRYLDS
ncbi:MAG: CDP-alcohol phosphatidyltransferase family protein [bacterium]